MRADVWGMCTRTPTLEEIEEARGRREAERRAQGLPLWIDDPSALLPFARTFNEAILEAPLDVDALRAEDATPVPA